MNIVKFKLWEDTHLEWREYEVDLDQMVMSDRISLLRTLLDRHDLTYDYSDDARVWEKGRQSYSLIMEVAETVPRKYFNIEWNRLVRKSFNKDFLETPEGQNWLRSEDIL